MMISDGFGYSKLKVSGFCRTSKNHKIFAPHVTHSGPEILQKSRTKKLVKSNTSISRKKIFFCQTPIFAFALAKMAKNQLLNCGKVFKLNIFMENIQL